MAYLIGAQLALATGALMSVTGFDRGRSYYPTVTIVVASYYCLFAAMAGSDAVLWREAAVATVFGVAAIMGFRTSLWLVVVALAAHGAMDLVHHHLITNPGMPQWWPGFCSAFDLTAAAYLALSLKLRGEPAAPPPWQKSGQ